MDHELSPAALVIVAIVVIAVLVCAYSLVMSTRHATHPDPGAASGSPTEGSTAASQPTALTADRDTDQTVLAKPAMNGR